VWVKICGITTPDGVQAVVDAGADSIGLVFAKSSRQIGLDRARGLLEVLDGRIAAVAVFRSPKAEYVAQVCALGFGWVQTESSWVGVLPAGVRWLPAVGDGDELYERVRLLSERVASEAPILIDGPGGGGLGRLADHRRIASVAARRPVVLAGGLSPENIGEAVRAVRPWGVDVSSGVEDAPGCKNPGRVCAFVEAARADGGAR
jgi:phosphoribosylanthranilate isomerase